MSNGTTALAALKLKRKFIGIELDEIHYSNAVQRIENTMKILTSKSDWNCMTNRYELEGILVCFGTYSSNLRSISSSKYQTNL